MRTFKIKFKALVKSGFSRHDALCKYLFQYRTTLHCTTGCTPAELQVGRTLRTRLSALKPSVRDTVEQNQAKQKLYFKGNRNGTFKKSDIVMTRDYTNSENKWQQGNVLDRLGPVTYAVQLQNNHVSKRHVDQIRPCTQMPFEEKSLKVPEIRAQDSNTDRAIDLMPEEDLIVSDKEHTVNNTGDAQENIINQEQCKVQIPVTPVIIRRSSRIKKQPNRMNL